MPVLQDFVKLAKWEDRGYYSLQMATEKSQRQLHRLSRRAEQALRQPVANVLADASAAMGFPDLADPEAVHAKADEKPDVKVRLRGFPELANPEAVYAKADQEPDFKVRPQLARLWTFSSKKLNAKQSAPLISA